MIQADLDAIRIYLESGNWPRALPARRSPARRRPGKRAPDPLFDRCDRDLRECASRRRLPGLLPRSTHCSRGDMALARHTLLTTPESRSMARDAQWLIAEQLSAITGLMLLRPHLVRLKTDLQSTRGAERPLNALRAAASQLEVAPGGGVTGLRVLYEDVERSLEHLGSELERSGARWNDSGHNGALATVEARPASHPRHRRASRSGRAHRGRRSAPRRGLAAHCRRH